MRSEQEIFKELALLCISPGYIHAIAFFSARDNFIDFDGDSKPEDIVEIFSKSRLIRTEISTLIGLVIRSPIDFSVPIPSEFLRYVNNTEELLKELHKAVSPNRPGKGTLIEAQEDTSSMSIDEALREGCFYCGELAYLHQYRDLAPLKYRADAKWLKKYKNIDLGICCDVIRCVTKLLEAQLTVGLRTFLEDSCEEWTLLPSFTLECGEIASRINQPIESVRAFLEAFSVSELERNDEFNSMFDFNAACSYPFIQMGIDKYLLLQPLGLAEAFYETPYYWMIADENYIETANKHRGEFAEDFATNRLRQIFGVRHVFQNVEIHKSKKTILGEIDVLVIYGDCLIVLQAKTKKLTLGARTGKVRLLVSDFMKAVQNSVEQSFRCATKLLEPSVILRESNGKSVPKVKNPLKIFMVSLVAGSYPALSVQVHKFMQSRATEQIAAPLVLDIFALDSITEMLNKPIWFLSYLSTRTRSVVNLMAIHERVILSYHLSFHLALGIPSDPTWLRDDVSINLDLAMAARRDGFPGNSTPAGILTQYENTWLGRIVNEISNAPSPATVSIGLFLLAIEISKFVNFNQQIESMLARMKTDDDLRDVALPYPDLSSGISIHCSRLSDAETMFWLDWHCQNRKNRQKANSWFGLALRVDGTIRAIYALIEDRPAMSAIVS